MADKPLDQRPSENKPPRDEKGADTEGKTPAEERNEHTDELLDEAVEETFPASDPISVNITR